MSESIECTICLQPVSMKDEKREARVWDEDVPPGGWCHRTCWEREHAPAGSDAALARDIFQPSPGGRDAADDGAPEGRGRRSPVDQSG